jgi:TatD DNase family protein
VLSRAEAEGVRRFVVVGFDLRSSERALRLAQSDPHIFAVVGVHPHDAREYDARTEDRLRAMAADPRVVAIGEIGLDFYRDLSPRDAQNFAFVSQLDLAREVGLPVVIHCRDAYPETLDILESEADGLTVVVHCFSGNLAEARRCWARGWYTGIDGPVTYKKNDDLREIVRGAPRDLLLIETDAPYLSPEPLRGKFPNEPARVALVAAKVAEVRGEPVVEVADYTTANALRAFPRLGA